MLLKHKNIKHKLYLIFIKQKADLDGDGGRNNGELFV